METLKTLLERLQIGSYADLRRYISEYDSSRGDLKVVTANELELDDEQRIYGDFVYERTIFDVDRLNIFNAKVISVRDCIFIGGLRIGNKSHEKVSISMDYVAVRGDLVIAGVGAGGGISLTRVRAPEIRIYNDQVESVSLVFVEAGLLTLESCKANDLYVNNCSFGAVGIAENDFERVYFPRGQLDVYSQLASDRKHWIESLKRSFSCLAFSSAFDFDEAAKKESLNKTNETFRFLLKYSDYHLSKGERAKIAYLEGLSSIRSPIRRLLYRAVGGFLMPWRILAVCGATVLVFATLYATAGWQFNVSGNQGTQSLSVLEALYFSGVSFSTIGYGDITPLGGARLGAVTEGMFGIVLSSSFVVALVRRYIE